MITICECRPGLSSDVPLSDTLTVLGASALLSSLPLLTLASSAQDAARYRLCSEGLLPPTGWVYRPGDDGVFASQAVDDKAWRAGVPMFRVGDHPKDWPGVGWFRTRVVLPERWVGADLGVFASYGGQFQLYLNGKRVFSRGEGEPQVQIGELLGTYRAEKRELLVALRVKTPRASLASGKVDWHGVWVELCDPVQGVSDVLAKAGFTRFIYVWFIGFAFALGILHLFLHFSVREDRAGHLDYSMFTLGAGLLSIFVVLRTLGGSLNLYSLWSIGFAGSIVFLATFGLRFFARAVYGSKSWLRPLGLYVGAAMMLLVPWLSTSAVYAYGMLTLILDAWLVVGLVRKRSLDGYLMLFGVWVMVVASTIQMAPELISLRNHYDYACIPGFVVLLVAMSAQLARSVGRTQFALAERVREVQDLSEAHLAEQARFQEAELERLALEAKNREQATRLKLLEELAETHEKLKTAQAQLAHSEKMASLGQLVAGVAHEMNTPIGAIYSVRSSLSKAATLLQQRLEVLAPDAVGDRKVVATLKVLRDSAEVVASGSERVSSIVRRLKSFARLDEAQLQRVDIHEGLEDTLLLARHELKHGIKVRREYAQLAPLACYPGQLNQVFLNLVMNARQAMGKEGTLTVTTRDAGDGVEVSIADDGAGIKPEHLPRIFDPGFTTKGVGVGTGLGLAICDRIVEAHFGSIRVESELGRGATFRIWLPKDLEARSIAKGCEISS